MERVTDLCRRLAVGDLEDDLPEVRNADRLRETWAEVAADDIGHKWKLQSRRVLGAPVGNGMEEHRARKEVQPAEDDTGQHQGEHHEAQNRADSAGPRRPVVAAVLRARAPSGGRARNVLCRRVEVVPACVDKRAFRAGPASDASTTRVWRILAALQTHSIPRSAGWP